MKSNNNTAHIHFCLMTQSQLQFFRHIIYAQRSQSVCLARQRAVRFKSSSLESVLSASQSKQHYQARSVRNYILTSIDAASYISNASTIYIHIYHPCNNNMVIDILLQNLGLCLQVLLIFTILFLHILNLLLMVIKTYIYMQDTPVSLRLTGGSHKQG